MSKSHVLFIQHRDSDTPCTFEHVAFSLLCVTASSPGSGEVFLSFKGDVTKTKDHNRWEKSFIESEGTHSLTWMERESWTGGRRQMGVRFVLLSRIGTWRQICGHANCKGSSSTYDCTREGVEGEHPKAPDLQNLSLFPQSPGGEGSDNQRQQGAVWDVSSAVLGINPVDINQKCSAAFRTLSFGNFEINQNRIT